MEEAYETEWQWFRRAIRDSLLRPSAFASSLAREHYGLAGVLVALLAGFALSVSVDWLVLAPQGLSPLSLATRILLHAALLGLRLAIVAARGSAALAPLLPPAPPHRPPRGPGLPAPRARGGGDGAGRHPAPAPRPGDAHRVPGAGVPARARARARGGPAGRRRGGDRRRLSAHAPVALDGSAPRHRRRDRPLRDADRRPHGAACVGQRPRRSEEHTSELQSPDHLVCRLLLEKKKN